MSPRSAAVALAKRLGAAGFLAADEEAALLTTAASGDPSLLELLVLRRLTGEPLAWIVGSVRFCGVELRVEPGVYVPRPHTEQLARRAAGRLPADGTAIDLCTGCGAIARVLATEHPGAHVVGSDIDPGAVACARSNGVDAYQGDLFEPLPRDRATNVDVITAVVPYVPIGELHHLQRDTFAFEQPLAYDGGADGMDVLRRVAEESRLRLRRGGALLLELGGRQDRVMRAVLQDLGFVDIGVLRDDDADVRGVEATLA